MTEARCFYGFQIAMEVCIFMSLIYLFVYLFIYLFVYLFYLFVEYSFRDVQFTN